MIFVNLIDMAKRILRCYSLGSQKRFHQKLKWQLAIKIFLFADDSMSFNSMNRDKLKATSDMEKDNEAINQMSTN